MLQNIISLDRFKGVCNIRSGDDIASYRGESFLRRAENVIVDNGGVLKSPNKAERVIEGVVNSLFSDGSVLYGIHNGSLFAYDGFEFHYLLQLARSEVSFCRGPGVVFFTGDDYIGQIANFSVTFPSSVNSRTYTFTDFSLSGGKELKPVGSESVTLSRDPLPTGDLCAFYGARVFVSDGSTLLFSDPFDFLYMSSDNFIQVDGVVTSILGVSDFLFIGTSNGAFIFRFSENASTLKRVAAGHILRNSAVYIHGEAELPRDMLLFVCNGSVMVTDGVEAENLSKHFSIENAVECVGVGRLCDEGLFYCIREGE